MRFATLTLILLTLAVALSPPQHAQDRRALGAPVSTGEPAAGTWKLNLAKSKYSPGPPPKSATVTYKASGDGVERTGTTINADGKKLSFRYNAKYDGKDYPVIDNPNADTISLKRIDARTVEATLKKEGKLRSTGRRVVSKDGKVLTLTLTGTTAEGKPFKNVAVYERQ